MDMRLMSDITNVLEKSLEYLQQLAESKGASKVNFVPYSNGFINDDIIYASKSCPNLNESRMFHVTHLYDEHGTIIRVGHDSSQVADTSANIYMPLENLYELILDCRMDFENVYKSMQFELRHQVGHILIIRQDLIGTYGDERNKYISDNRHDPNKRGPIRTDRDSVYLDYGVRLQHYIDYYNLPEEKRVNEIVGITEQDVIDDFRRTNLK